MRGGTRTVARLPINPSIKTGAELEAAWDFKLLAGHGSLIPNQYTVVPPNTYVLFNCSVGCRSVFEDGVPFGDRLYNDDRSDFFNELLAEIKNPKDLMKTYSDVTRKSLFTHLNRIEKVTNSNFNSTCSSISEKQRSRAIYTPGTLLHDMVIEYKNNEFGGMFIGVFDLPLNPIMKNAFKQFPTFTSPAIFDQTCFTRNDALGYRNIANNLMPSWIGRTAPLSAVFSKFVTPGHTLYVTRPRLVFVTACRGLEIPDVETRAMYTKLVRANSIGKREGAPSNLVAEGVLARNAIRRRTINPAPAATPAGGAVAGAAGAGAGAAAGGAGAGAGAAAGGAGAGAGATVTPPATP